MIEPRALIQYRDHHMLLLSRAGHGKHSALGVIADVWLLSHCDWLVGTHASAVSKATSLR